MGGWIRIPRDPKYLNPFVPIVSGLPKTYEVVEEKDLEPFLLKPEGSNYSMPKIRLFVKSFLDYLTFNLCFDTILIKNSFSARLCAKPMKDKTFVALSGIFFLLFVIGIGAVTLNKPISTMLRAKNVASSPLKSFGMIFPQIASVGDPAKGIKPADVKVSIYIRGVDGSILPNRSVKLAADPANVSIEPADVQVTNDIGQAQFTISSQVVGKVKLIARETTSNTEIINIPTVEFVK